MTKPACDSMSNHRRPDSLAYHQSESRTRVTHQCVSIRPGESVDNHISPGRSLTSPNGGREVRLPTQPVRLR
jgi:hypothetical protein